ncbi:substrate-binding domain-containing protein [Nocardioides sp.]|uniref:substrate-binding domain-containing protein n=1 Tax=Nocardioides sp. TaxID=35761 RepID=UPI00262E0F10|nr:substrate-binding domain-containing protein [Nocardioides sp.]
MRALILALAVLALGVLRPTAAFASYAQIEGSGSTWSFTIVQQWIADVSASGMQITFNNNGSSQGRKDFANSVTDFGITEIPYQGTDPITHTADKSNRAYSYLPIVAGGTAFTYHINVGGKLYQNLRLSGETIAKIFTNKITNWNDPAITKDNNGHALPSLTIHPVVRSDGSGTTAQFTLWMAKTNPTLWKAYSGSAELTSQYPRKGAQIAASGSDQVMNTISSAAGNGTIGYVEYAYPLNAKYPVVKVENKAGYFVQPTQYNVAVALQHAKINTSNPSDPTTYLTQDLSGVYVAPEVQAYPISSYSYMIIPTAANDQRMTTAKRQTLADFLSYSLCAGQAKAGPYGYSPLPLNLVQAGFDQVKKLKTADAAVDLSNRDVTQCKNPTFVAGNLKANHLAQIAPKPEACDKVGAGPCGVTAAATGGGTTTTSGGSGTTTGTTTTPTGGGGAAPGSSGVGTTTDPGTTGDGSTTTVAAATGATANAIELSSARTGDNRLFGVVAVAELLAVVLVPGLYVAWLRRRKGGVA